MIRATLGTDMSCLLGLDPHDSTRLGFRRHFETIPSINLAPCAPHPGTDGKIQIRLVEYQLRSNRGTRRIVIGCEHYSSNVTLHETPQSPRNSTLVKATGPMVCTMPSTVP